MDTYTLGNLIFFSLQYTLVILYYYLRTYDNDIHTNVRICIWYLLSYGFACVSVYVYTYTLIYKKITSMCVNINIKASPRFKFVSSLLACLSNFTFSSSFYSINGDFTGKLFTPRSYYLRTRLLFVSTLRWAIYTITYYVYKMIITKLYMQIYTHGGCVWILFSWWLDFIFSFYKDNINEISHMNKNNYSSPCFCKTKLILILYIFSSSYLFDLVQIK